MKKVSKFQRLISNSRLILVAGLGVAIGVLLMIIFYQENKQVVAVNQLPINQRLQASPDKILRYTDYSDKAVGNESIIKYTYVSDQVVPPQTYQGWPEDLSRRTNNSQAFIQEATADKTVYVGKFYSGDQFYQRGSDWYQIETATTTKTAFLLQTKATILDQVKTIFGRPAFAATYYAGAGDGYTQGDCSGWDSVHDHSGTFNYTGDSIHIQSQYDEVNDCYFSIFRGFLPFDTSGLPDNSRALSASVNVYPIYVYDHDNDGNDFVTVVQTSQASPTALVAADHLQCGAVDNPTEGIDVSERKDITSISADQYLTFNLNSVGKNWISPTGYTQLGLREGHDVLDLPVEQGKYLSTGIVIYSSEAAGFSQDPYLEVSYEVITRVKIDGGRMKLDGGRLKID